MVKYLYGMLGIVVSCAKGDLQFHKTCGLFLWMCVVYEALGDALRMDFAVAFLELWLRMISLELWLKIEGKHETFLELWLKMTSLKLWLGTANGHAHSLSCGSGWRRLPV